MANNDSEEKRLRSAALQNSTAILLARERVERELVEAKEALERKTEELSYSLAMVQATLESTTDAILVTNADGAITGSNKNFFEMWKIPVEVMTSRNHVDLLSFGAGQYDSNVVRTRLEQIYALSPQETYDLLEPLDGRVIERFSKTQSIDGRHVGRVWSFRDITARTRAEQELRKLAAERETDRARLRELTLTDPLTGLANRRGLEESLLSEYERVQRYGQPVSIIMADIDHFKHVNDRHGHDVGDEVLQNFATVLRAGLRGIDRVARLGGEEFIVVLPMTALDGAMMIAERLRSNTLKMRVKSCVGELSASFGVAQFQHNDTVPGLLKHADDALYVAKKSGRNRVEAYARPSHQQTAAR